jgi:hypothetical protein
MDCLKNVKYYPLGQAELELTENSLKIKNLSDSGLDGIMIEVNGAENFNLDFKDFQIGIDNSFNVSHIGIDEWGRLKTLAQQSIYFNPNTNRVETAFNSRMSSKNGIWLEGILNNSTIFQGRYPNPEYDPCINWWPLVAGAVGWVVSKIDYTYKKESGPNGVTTTHEVSWNNNLSGGDKDGSVITFDGIRFNANNLLYTSKETFPKEIPTNEIRAVQITAKNYSQLEIIGGKIC